MPEKDFVFVLFFIYFFFLRKGQIPQYQLHLHNVYLFNLRKIQIGQLFVFVSYLNTSSRIFITIFFFTCVYITTGSEIILNLPRMSYFYLKNLLGTSTRVKNCQTNYAMYYPFPSMKRTWMEWWDFLFAQEISRRVARLKLTLEGHIGIVQLNLICCLQLPRYTRSCLVKVTDD